MAAAKVALVDEHSRLEALLEGGAYDAEVRRRAPASTQLARPGDAVALAAHLHVGLDGLQQGEEVVVTDTSGKRWARRTWSWGIVVWVAELRGGRSRSRQAFPIQVEIAYPPGALRSGEAAISLYKS